MMSEAHITTIDPEVPGRAALPSVPNAGVVLVRVPDDSGDVCAWHLLDFARRWRDEGRKVHLCDGCVDTPILHHAADVQNAEGVTDTILYGSSLPRISVPLEKDVVLTTAGTVVGDSARVLEHPRWVSIAATVGDSGGLLVVTVAADADAERLEGLADAAIRFVPGHEATDAAPAGAPGATTDPSGAALPAAAATGLGQAAMDHGKYSATEKAASAAPADTSPPAAAPAAGPARKKDSGTRTLVLFILLLLALLAVLGAGYLGFVEIPGVTPADVDLPIDTFSLR